MDAADGSVDVEALREKHAVELGALEAASARVRSLKESGAPKEEVDAAVEALQAAKDALPIELLPTRDAKKRQKRLVSEAKAKEKAERTAKFAAMQEKSKNKKKTIKTGTNFINMTPIGDKKDVNGEMPSAYEPPAVEAAWDAWWEKKGFYTADASEAKLESEKNKFVMVIPPPNVTGSLHIGHALTCAIEDALCRWHRMTGKYVMWLPGTDHAGIATQAVVEKKIMRENQLTRRDVGREKFVEKVWEWKETNGAKILHQLRMLGASVDHSRTVFTMDEPRSRCVIEAFVRMYEDGLVYRDTRLVNWSHALCTALSDIEVDHLDLSGRTLLKVKGHDQKKQYEFGTLTSFAYKIANEDGSGSTDEEIVVATTRLETMLGDTGVAVNPEDVRYKHLHGKFVFHPFRKCAIPIVTDAELVDMEFGTGAVKITPAHDPNDFACGRRHGLQELSILNDDGTINGICGAPFERMMRYDARIAVEEELKKIGLFRDKKSHEMQIPICSRSGDVIEPRLKPQWWVNCKQMAAEAVEKVRSGDLMFYPESAKQTWYYWLENIHDWCISRQLWWGHRIPAFKIVSPAIPADKDPWIVGRDVTEATQRAATKFNIPESEIKLEQDPDVLDTWFSAGLFPFSTFGWMQEGDKAKHELEAFFPGTLLETGHDIIFFWVARMVMMSLQLHKTLPFKTVFFHPMVRDKFGRKMSKSLGNVVSPEQVIEGVSLEEMNRALEMNTNLPPDEIEKAKEGQRLAYEATNGIPQCGADALRFGLLSYCSPTSSRDLNLDISLVARDRRFCNKLWQATKFCMMNLGEDFTPEKTFFEDVVVGKFPQLALRDRWILSCMHTACDACNEAFVGFDFQRATHAAYKFFLEQFCDVYVEAVKPVMKRAKEADAAKQAKMARHLARNCLWWCLDVSFRLMHPLMPFVTEELWQRLPGRPSDAVESIMIAHFPGSGVFVKHKSNHRIQAETDAILKLKDEDAQQYFGEISPLCSAMRSLAVDFNVNSNKNLIFYLKLSESAASRHALITSAIDDIQVLSNAKEVHVLPLNQTDFPQGCTAKLYDAEVQILLELKGILDPAKEIARVEKQIEKVRKDLEKAQNKVDSENFVKLTPDIQQRFRDQARNLQLKLEGLEESKSMFAGYAT